MFADAARIARKNLKNPARIFEVEWPSRLIDFPRTLLAVSRTQRPIGGASAKRQATNRIYADSASCSVCAGTGTVRLV